MYLSFYVVQKILKQDFNSTNQILQMTKNTTSRWPSASHPPILTYRRQCSGAQLAIVYDCQPFLGESKLPITNHQSPITDHKSPNTQSRSSFHSGRGLPLSSSIATTGSTNQPIHYLSYHVQHHTGIYHRFSTHLHGNPIHHQHC